MREAPDEAPFLERRDEPMDPGFRPQIKSFLHFLEGGRNAGLFQPFVDEHQQFILLARQHASPFRPKNRRLGTKLKHLYLFPLCSASAIST
jgi:hypothetical protein